MASCFDKLLKLIQQPIPEAILGKLTFAVSCHSKIRSIFNRFLDGHCLELSERDSWDHPSRSVPAWSSSIFHLSSFVRCQTVEHSHWWTGNDQIMWFRHQWCTDWIDGQITQCRLCCLHVPRTHRASWSKTSWLRHSCWYLEFRNHTGSSASNVDQRTSSVLDRIVNQRLSVFELSIGFRRHVAHRHGSGATVTNEFLLFQRISFLRRSLVTRSVSRRRFVSIRSFFRSSLIKDYKQRPKYVQLMLQPFFIQSRDSSVDVAGWYRQVTQGKTAHWNSFLLRIYSSFFHIKIYIYIYTYVCVRVCLCTWLWCF